MLRLEGATILAKLRNLLSVYARERPDCISPRYLGASAWSRGFANIYREAARLIRAEVNGDLTPEVLDFPTIDGGLEGMAFITTAVQSAKAGGVWAKMPAST